MKRRPVTVELYLGDLTLECEVDATPYVPAQTWGPPESCYPAEGGEVEVNSARVHSPDGTGTIDILPLLVALGAGERLEELITNKLADSEPDEPNYPEED